MIYTIEKIREHCPSLYETFAAAVPADELHWALNYAVKRQLEALPGPGELFPNSDELLEEWIKKGKKHGLDFSGKL